MSFWLEMLADGFFALIAAIGFAIVSNPPRKILLTAGLFAAVGHMARFVLMHQGMGIASASLGASMLIAFCSMPLARRWHTPAELFIFPSLLPMIPGMFAYKTILAIMRFLEAEDAVLREVQLVDIVYNGLTALFIMCALVIGAILPLVVFHRESPLSRGLHGLRWHGGRGGRS